MAKLTVLFSAEKDTKNTRKFEELGATITQDDGTEQHSPAPAINTLYVQKWAAQAVGGGKMPKHITVTLEVADADNE